MQFRFLPSLIVFLGSYMPLGVILLAQDANYDLLGRRLCLDLLVPGSGCVLPFGNPAYSVTIFLVCLVCFVLSLVALKATKPTIPIDVLEARHIPAELMSYTLPYVVSFMSLDYRDTGAFMGLLVFLAWMFWITHKSGQLILNPVFTAFGWRYYEVSYTFPGGDGTPHQKRALSRYQLKAGRYFHTAIQDVDILSPEKGQG